MKKENDNSKLNVHTHLGLSRWNTPSNLQALMDQDCMFKNKEACKLQKHAITRNAHWHVCINVLYSLSYTCTCMIVTENTQSGTRMTKRLTWTRAKYICTHIHTMHGCTLMYRSSCRVTYPLLCESAVRLYLDLQSWGREKKLLASPKTWSICCTRNSGY